MRTVKFKDPHTRLKVDGMGEITSDNLTVEKYDRLVALSSSHESLFIVTDDAAEKKTKTKNTSADETAVQA